jgi:hypothetical protein
MWLSAALDEIRTFAATIKDILLNPSAPVGRIDGGHHLYAPRRPRFNELLKDYASRRTIEHAFGRRTVDALVRT